MSTHSLQCRAQSLLLAITTLGRWLLLSFLPFAQDTAHTDIHTIPLQPSRSCSCESRATGWEKSQTATTVTKTRETQPTRTNERTKRNFWVTPTNGRAHCVYVAFNGCRWSVCMRLAVHVFVRFIVELTRRKYIVAYDLTVATIFFFCFFLFTFKVILFLSVYVYNRRWFAAHTFIGKIIFFFSSVFRSVIPYRVCAGRCSSCEP